MKNAFLLGVLFFLLFNSQLLISQPTIGNEPYNSFSVSSAGWYRVGDWSGAARGAVRVVLSTLGGPYTPQSIVIDAYRDWGAGVQLEVKGIRSSYFDHVRITRSNDNYYLEVYIDREVSGRLYMYDLEGHVSNFNLASGNLNAGSGQEMKKITEIYDGKHYTDHLEVTDGIAKFGKSRFNVLSYGLNGTPDHGVKIKTNLLFQHGSQMPTLFIEGYAYGDRKPIALQVVWYVYDGRFLNPTISSFGSYTPKISIGEENGKVVLYIHDKQYYQRFSIRAYETGRAADNNTWYKGWTAVDEPFNGNYAKEFTYSNQFAGNVVVNSLESQPANLRVEGRVHATEVKVSTDAASVPDYVFKPHYDLMSLDSLSKFVNLNSHLPDIPNANEMEKNGIDLGEMNLKLLKKVEELSLYLIEQNEAIKSMNEKLDKQEQEIQNLKKN